MVKILVEGNNVQTFFFTEDIPENVKDRVIEVDNVPEPQELVGKYPVAKWDDVNKKVYFEYLDRPLTQEEEMTQLKEKQELMQQAIDDLIFGGVL
jgi:hypothetical protein